MIIQKIKDRLEEYSNPEKARRLKVYWQKLYHEVPELYGVATPIVRQLSSEFFQRVKKKPKQEILQLCNKLLRSGLSEEKTIAFDWAFRLRRMYEKSDFRLLESWLMTYVHGWGACDDLCTHALGAFIYQFPEFIQDTREWTRSTNRWIRRASAVCLIYSVRRKVHLREVFETAGALLIDKDVMVQKGYGWMLKEASNHYPKEVFNYVMKYKSEMPRTALRYAIEKLPPEQRTETMKRK